MMCRAFIALGSNVGDRERFLKQAVKELKAVASIALIRESSIIDTEPAGGPPQGRFLNQVIEIETSLSPEALLAELQRVERRCGRVRREKWGPRTLDLDILLYGDRIIHQPGLDIPHPRMLHRSFVLRPLCEIAPSFVHPVTRQRICDILEENSRE